METDNGTSLSQVMSAISPQLLALGTEVAKLEEIIGPILSGESPPPADLIVELQTLDWLRQSILDLARLTRHLSEIAVDEIVSKGQMEAVSQTLHLSVTKSLLKGDIDQDFSLGNSDCQSDLQMF